MCADFIGTRCGGCNRILDEDPHAPSEGRPPCPDCGSAARALQIQASETAHVRKRLGLKMRTPGKKRPAVEQVVGDDLHRKSGTWKHLERLIDRVNNRYREVVTDPETGEVVHACDEPLSDHTNHGTPAKTKADPPADDA